MALITKVNKPKLKTFIGRVIKLSIGFREIFTIAITAAATKAVKNPSNFIPGTNQAVNITIKVNAIHFNNKYINTSPLPVLYKQSKNKFKLPHRKILVV